MHARYYSAANGKFLSVDPGRDFDVNSTQSWNLYAYGGNNPINVTDPTGRWEMMSTLANAYESAASGLEKAADKIEDFTYEHTGAGSSGIVVNTLAGVAGDVLRSTGDSLRVGQASGAAAGSGANGIDMTKAICKDVVRGGQVALTLTVPAEAGLRSAFATQAGKAAFYAGGPAARAAAEASGGTTMGMTAGGKFITRVAGSSDGFWANEMVKTGSRYFARGATGEANAYVGTAIRANSHLTNIELPMLSSRGIRVVPHGVP
jgi:hypothetical protein